jgi:uncharacterized protein (TIGR02271 family)
MGAIDRNKGDRRTEAVVPIHEERLKVSKETVETAKVTISKRVGEYIEQVNVPIVNEHVVIDRLPKNETYDTAPPSVYFEGDTMIVRVIKEIPVVVTKYQVIEELHITKEKTEVPLQQEITLRKEHVIISRKDLNIDEQLNKEDL